MSALTYVTVLTGLILVDFAGWIFIRRHLFRLKWLNLPMRGVAAVGTLTLGLVFGAIPLSTLGPAGIPHSLAAAILGAEAGIAVNFHYIWARGLWNGVAADARSRLRSHL